MNNLYKTFLNIWILCNETRLLWLYWWNESENVYGNYEIWKASKNLNSQLFTITIMRPPLVIIVMFKHTIHICSNGNYLINILYNLLEFKVTFLPYKFSIMDIMTIVTSSYSVMKFQNGSVNVLAHNMFIKIFCGKWLNSFMYPCSQDATYSEWKMINDYINEFLNTNEILFATRFSDVTMEHHRDQQQQPIFATAWEKSHDCLWQFSSKL